MNLLDFQKKTGYIYKNPNLLETAFTHPSYANEHGLESYERLEYLGDAIVDFIVGEYLFLNHSELNEGDMSRIRALLVCEKALGELAVKLDIGKYIRLGKGAEQSGDRSRPSVLSDVFEAHIAAMYLDNGLERTREYLLSIYGSAIEDAATSKAIDYKTMLQEKLQKNGPCHIEYELVSADGPIHNCLFTFRVLCNDKELGRGEALSKKQAQQLAAKKR